MSRLLVSSLLCILLLGGTEPSCAQITRSGYGQLTRALLSVDGLSIPADHSLSAFQIKTWGVSLLSVCSIPQSWNLTEEKYEDPEGVLVGRSDVHGAPLRELRQMYLVDVLDYRPLPKGNPKGDYRPATFSGWIEVARESWNMHGRRRSISSKSFHLTPATRCPVPPPSDS